MHKDENLLDIPDKGGGGSENTKILQTSYMRMIPQQFGVDSGLTTANTNAALSLNPFLNQQTSPAQSSRLSVRVLQCMKLPADFLG